MSPPARSAEVFFTGGRYLMHEKVFFLGQVVSDFSLSSFCLLSVKDVEVQVLIGLFQVQLGKSKVLITASHQYIWPTSYLCILRVRIYG